MMSQPQNTHPRRDWLMAWTWPMFLQLQLDSRTQYMRIRQESKRATGCGNTTGTDWIICREFWKDQQSKKKSCAGCEHPVFQQRPILVALLKICIPRDLLHSIPSSTGERSSRKQTRPTFPFDSHSFLSSVWPFVNLCLFFYSLSLDFAASWA
jgi:hypothetical protein